MLPSAGAPCRTFHELARRLRVIEPRCLHVFLFLLTNDGRELPLRSISQGVGKTVRAIERNIRELEAAGLVVRESEPSRANTYRVRWP
jgi:DNA-binding MarR family transcriptional regulator